MLKYQSISYLVDLEKEELKNKRVLVRVDFNVPLNEGMKVTDDTRIIASLETIKYLISNNCAVILMSHLGRPGGKIVEKMRLDPVASHLEGLLQKKVTKLDDCIGDEVQREILGLNSGEIILLENLRFHQEEKKNDPIFAKQLASLADIYVNDAFGAAHRAHASTTGIAAYIPSYAGFLMAKELKSLDKLLLEPERPFIAIIGGAKVSDKIEVLEKLIKVCDILLIGGGMAYTFLFAQGYEVGKSILEEDLIDSVSKIIEEAEKRNIEMILPKDIIVAKAFKEDAESFNVSIGDIEKDMIGMGIGNNTTKLFEQKIDSARTIFWNGPLGVFEMKQFAENTNHIASKIAKLSDRVFSVGGGDSIAAINQLNLKNKISHISTGGGASLEYISGRKMPGLEALRK